MLSKTIHNQDFILKEFTPCDWEQFKNIRLEALKDCPDVFCPKENEFERPDVRWREMLEDNSNFQAFCLYHLSDLNAEQNIGLTGVLNDRDDPSGQTALFVMSYINPKFRRHGLSSLFYEARIAWANRHPQYKRIKIGHRENNEASKRANQKFGFVFSDKSLITWNDGQKDYLCNYYLSLQK